jgi:hypothetical protein
VPVDLVFVLDSSASLGATNWLLVKTLAANIVEQFTIGSADTRYVRCATAVACDVF